MKNIINILKKNKTDILISFIFAFVIALVLAANSYAQRVTENITQSVVRFMCWQTVIPSMIRV